MAGTNWESFAQQAPDLAVIGRDRFEESGLCLVGTLRKDGSPRISPVEPYIVDGELLLGMMWRSRKALDLLRDPRLVVHTCQCDPKAAGGDLKLYGKAAPIDDPQVKSRYGDATEARIDWRPEEPFHVFAVAIDSAGYITFGDNRVAMTWNSKSGFERIPHPDD